MKFSKKGKFKLQEFLYEYGAYVAGSRNANAVRPIEFDQDDFKGCVVLTRKEAAKILDFLSYLDMRSYRDSFLDGLTECCKELKDKIEKT